MTWDEVTALAKRLPQVEEASSYGTPGLKVRGKLLTRLRLEDDSLVLIGVGFDEREMLMEAAPEIFHTTPHYKDYPSVLARLAAVDPGTVFNLLERRWRAVAPKRLVKAYDEAAGDCAAPPPGRDRLQGRRPSARNTNWPKARPGRKVNSPAMTKAPTIRFSTTRWWRATRAVRPK
jgi:hypothetical protein